MSQLLISVRDRDEAIVAATAGADIVDLKDPAAGSLGCVDRREVVRVVKSLTAGSRLSLAMGELVDWQSQRFRDWPLPSFRFAKLGLANLAGSHSWQRKWQSWQASLPTTTEPVAVSYVDWKRAQALPPNVIAETAIEMGFRYVLVDTYQKSSGHLLDYLTLAQLKDLADQLASRSMTLAAAGSLDLELLPPLLDANIPILAIRGAVRESGRNSPVSARRIRQWREAMSSHKDRLRPQTVVPGHRR